MKNTQARPTTMLDSLAGGPPNYPPSSGRLLFAMHECEHMRSPEITCRSTARGPTGCEPRHFNKSFSRTCTLRSASLVRASQESGEQSGQSQASCNAGGTSVSSLPLSDFWCGRARRAGCGCHLVLVCRVAPACTTPVPHRLASEVPSSSVLRRACLVCPCHNSSIWALAIQLRPLTPPCRIARHGTLHNLAAFRSALAASVSRVAVLHGTGPEIAPVLLTVGALGKKHLTTRALALVSAPPCRIALHGPLDDTTLIPRCLLWRHFRLRHHSLLMLSLLMLLLHIHFFDRLHRLIVHANARAQHGEQHCHLPCHHCLREANKTRSQPTN